ncbi:hypothetical protein ACMFMG_004734 [Clarireedia jacksonii]
MCRNDLVISHISVLFSFSVFMPCYAIQERPFTSASAATATATSTPPQQQDALSLTYTYATEIYCWSSHHMRNPRRHDDVLELCPKMRVGYENYFLATTSFCRESIPEGTVQEYTCDVQKAVNSSIRLNWNREFNKLDDMQTYGV